MHISSTFLLFALRGPSIGMKCPIFFMIIVTNNRSVAARGPRGLDPLPVSCDSVCPPGVSCPEYDGCFIQGKASMSAEAANLCSSTVASALAADRTNCAASVSTQKASYEAMISAEQTQCQSRIRDQQTLCANQVASLSSELAKYQPSPQPSPQPRSKDPIGTRYKTLQHTPWRDCKTLCEKDRECYACGANHSGNCYFYKDGMCPGDKFCYYNWYREDE
jgi:hypothetical protein